MENFKELLKASADQIREATDKQIEKSIRLYVFSPIIGEITPEELESRGVEVVTEYNPKTMEYNRFITQHGERVSPKEIIAKGL